MDNTVKTEPASNQLGQTPRVSSRPTKRKSFFDEEQPKPAVKPNPSKRLSASTVTAKPKAKTEPKKAYRKCEKSGCSATVPICFVNATERCAGNGYTSRWYHISPAEHFCNECFEYYYRSHKDGYEVFTAWKRQWSSNSKTEPASAAFMMDQVLPYWVQCTLPGCGKWRQLSRDLELSPNFIRRYTCGMSAQGSRCVKSAKRVTAHVRFEVQNEKQAENCGRLEDEVHCLKMCLNHQKLPESDSIIQPFAISVEPMRAQSFDPAAMLSMEEMEFPGYVREPVMYLGLRNLVVALWANNVTERVSLERCVPHIICRGIARLHYVQAAERIISFLTRQGYINCGLLSPSEEPALLPKEHSQEMVAVIGAGPAGLAAARHLNSLGAKVIVLEARDRIGGRVWDVESLGQAVGKGAQMIIGDINNPITLICQQTGVPMKRVKDRCDLFTSCGKCVEHRQTQTDKRIDFHFNAMLDIIAEWRKTKTKLPDVDLLQKIWEKHQQFMEESQMEFTEEETQALQFHISNLEFACGAPLDKVSALYWDQNESFPQFAGSHVFIQGWHSKILTTVADGLDVRLNTEVVKIDYSSDLISIATDQRRDLHSSKVLVTLPLGVLKRDKTLFTPLLPEHKQLAISSLGTGVIEKVALQFPTKFWESKMKGSMVFGQIPVSPDQRGLFNVFYDLTTVTQECNGDTTPHEQYILMSHMTGAAVTMIDDQSDEDVVAMCLQVLRTLFPPEEVPDPEKYFVTRWRDDRYAHMAYSFLPVGVDGSAYDVMAEEVNGKVYFAGEATSRAHPQSVTGAYLSGIREANKILESLDLS
ncbi:LOW QUALITY PROTEIN: lysine-specific histone demethylase 1B-like [Liolophura sinensis]|uniref:LOW QUALITY PROTEIN: lysine-specific histone demethylase 1B-like n=1 Tax=Liolophura sinensis TaxID=3198878 RepID=UPI003159854D